MNNSTATWRTWDSIRRHPAGMAVVVICLIAAGAGGYYYGYPLYEAAQQLRLARQQLNNFEFDDARESLELCLAIQPDNAEAHFLLGRTLRLVEDSPGAHRQLKEAERLGWPMAEINLEYLCMDLQGKGTLTKGNAAIKQMLETDVPERPELLQALVIGANHLNRLDKASTWLLVWIDKYPNDWRARFCYGIYLQNLGRLDLAQPEFEKALALNEAASPARRWLGVVLTKNGQNYSEAVRHLETYLQGHPNDPFALVNLAQSHWALNQPEAARADLQRLFKLVPNHIGGLLLLAQLEAEADHLAEALDALQRTENRPTEDLQEISTRVALRARVHRLRGEDKEAEVYERRVQEMTDDFQEIQRSLSVLMKDSKDLSLHRKVGIHYLRVGQLKEGLRYLDNVLVQRPDDAIAHKFMADFLAKYLDERRERLRQLRKVLLQHPDDTVAKKEIANINADRSDQEMEQTIKMHSDEAAQGKQYP